MANADADWRPNGRPESALARSFSAALDDLFQLNGLGALQESVEQKKDEVQTQQNQLSELDQQLREADERLKKLEAKHRRQSQMYAASRRPARTVVADEMEDETSEESDGHGRDSPQSQ